MLFGMSDGSPLLAAVAHVCGYARESRRVGVVGFCRR